MEVRSTAHDAVKCGRDRDYRRFALFFQGLFRRNGISVRLFDLRQREEGGYVPTVNLLMCTELPAEQTMMVDLIAFKRHMRWLKLCEDNLESDVRDWEENFKEHLSQFRAEGWEVKLANQVDSDQSSITLLNGWRFCKMKCVKTPCDTEQFYGKETPHQARKILECDREIPYLCGMAMLEAEYPMLNLNWRIPGPVCPLSEEFIRNAIVEFTLENVQAVATLGNRLVREYGDVRLAARRIQEIEARTLEPHVLATKELLKNTPNCVIRSHNCTQLAQCRISMERRHKHPDH